MASHAILVKSSTTLASSEITRANSIQEEIKLRKIAIIKIITKERLKKIVSLAKFFIIYTIKRTMRTILLQDTTKKAVANKLLTIRFK